MRAASIFRLLLSGGSDRLTAFLGKVTPAYLFHDLSALRNALNLLLANLDRPERVTSPMGEYARENPVKPRPYEALWAELLDSTE